MNVLRHGCKSLILKIAICNCLIYKLIHNLAGLKELSCIG
ncbi:hypothetical protein HMPREF9449_00087 [Odoribacter laneus YIT 12061]|uniref:Uncharacterized protein n=1 Tax=Odoribacter laneus YIT 12061 TaxID=742817 RepID=H1DCN0_9BACT|nr:hypothetical protein HMPREF9449_00087 [Odoribacter laneus YIT 12061]